MIAKPGNKTGAPSWPDPNTDPNDVRHSTDYMTKWRPLWYHNPCQFRQDSLLIVMQMAPLGSNEWTLIHTDSNQSTQVVLFIKQLTQNLVKIRKSVIARFLSVAQSKLRLCLANHRAGYFSNLACDWLSIVWAYSEQETENGPWLWLGAWQQTTTWLCPSWKGSMVPILCSWHHYCSMSEFYIDTVDLIHKSHNSPVSYPTMHYSVQKCAHFCFEWCIVGYGTGA